MKKIVLTLVTLILLNFTYNKAMQIIFQPNSKTITINNHRRTFDTPIFQYKKNPPQTEVAILTQDGLFTLLKKNAKEKQSFKLCQTIKNTHKPNTQIIFSQNAQYIVILHPMYDEYDRTTFQITILKQQENKYYNFIKSLYEETLPTKLSVKNNMLTYNIQTRNEQIEQKRFNLSTLCYITN